MNTDEQREAALQALLNINPIWLKRRVEALSKNLCIPMWDVADWVDVLMDGKSSWQASGISVPTLERYRATRRGLRRLGCISAHWAPSELSEKTDESIAYAKEFGMRQMAIAALGSFDSKGTETVDDVKRYVDPFNAFAEKAHAAGITALLHNEGFVSKHIDGKPVYDMMIAELNPAHDQAAV